MAHKRRELKGVIRGYIWKLYPDKEQVSSFKHQSILSIELWNGLLDITNALYKSKVWYFDKQASGPIVFGLDGNQYVLNLNDVLWWRKATRGRCRTLPLKPYQNTDLDSNCLRTKIPTNMEMGYWITQLRNHNQEYKALSTWVPRRVSDLLYLAWQRYFTPGHKRVPDVDYNPPRFKDFKRLWFPGRVYNPGLKNTGSGCLIEKSKDHKAKWLISVMGIPDKIWARRELPPGKIYEYKYFDIYFYDNAWWFAVSVDTASIRKASQDGSTTVKFNTIDYFADVNGVPFNPQMTYLNVDSQGVRHTRAYGFVELLQAEFDNARLQAAFDLKYPRSQISYLSEDDKDEMRLHRRKIQHAHAHIARMRRELNHKFTKQVIEQSGNKLIIMKPRIKYLTESPRGDEKNWGAAVKPVSELNHYILSQSISKVIDMLKYKAQEAGVDIDIIEDPEPIQIIGRMQVTAGKKRRQKGRTRLIQFMEVPGIEAEISQLNVAMYYAHEL